MPHPERPDYRRLLSMVPTITVEEAAGRDREYAWGERAKALEQLALPITATDERMLIRDELDKSGRVIQAVIAWFDSDSPWIVLTGSAGRGKTLAAAWVLMQHGGRYKPAREIERLSSARYGDEAEEFQRIVAGRTLVVDDIGRERDPGAMTSALLDLVDGRRRRVHKTIAIANLSKQDFCKTYADERLLSRLAEPGISTWVTDVGPDLRRRKS